MNEVLLAQVSVYDKPRGQNCQLFSVCRAPVSQSNWHISVYMLMYTLV